MLLTITTTSDDPASPASDLGHLLHKHPDRAQQLDVAGGRVHVFYPEADDARCTVALLLEVDPVALVRRRRGGDDAWLGQHVNDRPYAATSLLSVAMGRTFRTALAGRCDARPDLVDRPLPLRVHVPTMPADGDPDLVRRLFEPLGWHVDAHPIALDESVPEWGPSRYVDLTLTGELVLSRALAHLYVLVPVLDGAKHYWVSGDEVDKLVRAGDGWLPDHPERELVTRRYLKHQRDLVLSATERLAALDDRVVDVSDDSADDDAADDVRPLLVRRRDAVLDVLRAERASRVVDAGCGEGQLLNQLVRDPAFTEVVGLDVSARALEVAERRLGLDRLPDSQRDKLRLAQSSLTYRDDRFAGYDAVVLMEVVEHVDPDRLTAFEAQVFTGLAPRVVVMTTPNAEHNVRFDALPAGAFRHPDHRFEWTRAELAAWADAVAARHGYAVRYEPVGDDDPEVGPPTQMAVFTRLQPDVGAA